MVEQLAHTMAEAANIVRYSRSGLYEETRAGRLRTTKLGRRTVVLHGDLVAWLERKRAESDPEAGAVETEPDA